MARVELSRITKNFGSLEVIRGVDLSIASGEFLVLVGPSGCGKSTLLRIVAGLETQTSGHVSIEGNVVNALSPKERGIAMVFQNYALYPLMTVFKNMAFSLKLSGVPKDERERRVLETAKILRIEELLNKKPGQLSGGQKQRVAMGRAMVRKPKVFLFDEPLSNLDAQLRVKMRTEISLLHRTTGATIIYVTHDQVEAMTLADRIAIVNKGKIEQVGEPLEVYRHPQTQFVASFIGTPSMNFLPSSFASQLVLPSGAQTIGFRPEHVCWSESGGRVKVGSGKVHLVEPLGSNAHVHVSLGEHAVVTEQEMSVAPPTDSAVDLWIDPSKLFFFDREGASLSGRANV